MSTLEQALVQVERGADPEWVDEARTAVTLVAQDKPTLTTDDVWLLGLDKPREPRAMGVIMRWALNEGLIEKTDRFVPTVFPEGHKGPRQVWRSRVYQPALEAVA